MHVSEYHMRHKRPLKVGESVARRKAFRPMLPPTDDTLLRWAQERRAQARGTCPECHMGLTPTGCPSGC